MTAAPFGVDRCRSVGGWLINQSGTFSGLKRSNKVSFASETIGAGFGLLSSDILGATAG